jgi:hydroxypyruvate isomerase
VRRFAANVGFLFRELPYLERFAAARAAGFDAVEFAWPTVPVAAVESAVRDAGLSVALLNVAAGDLDAGDRGHAADPAQRNRWRTDFEAAMRLADAVACPALHVLAGNRLDGVAVDAQLACLRENLAWALPLARAAGRILTIELLNPVDTPRYLFTEPVALTSFLSEFDDPALRLQFDTYHVGLVTGDVVSTFRELSGLVGHIQVADVPGRHEPGTGGIDWDGFFNALDAAGYGGAIGLEYVSSGSTTESLAWLATA